jgi:trk system potassium uptake protein
MLAFLKRQPPVRIIAMGFALVILLGSGLLMLPCSIREGVALRYIDALYTSTSAVCVTGLIAADAGDTFTLFGQAVILLLIQVGGLGVTSIGAGVILLMGRKMNLRGLNLVQEAGNLESGHGVVRFVRSVFQTTLVIELCGAALSFITFVQHYSVPHAVWLSLFHAVAAFNNSGFDVLGGGQNLIPFQDDILLNLTTCALIFFGGIGFLVIREMVTNRRHWKRYSMHARVVLSVSGILTAAGTLLIKLTERGNITWLGAFFASVTARTAGFSTFPFSEFSNAGLLVVIVLMYIGASPGSTGGGIKTSTFFVLIRGVHAAASGQSEKAFHYAIPKEAFRKAAVVALLALALIFASATAVSVLEPDIPLRDILFEMVSAFATVGLSTGITAGLSVGSKLISILVMFIGRLGPLTVASLWHFSRIERISYPEGNISVG